MTRRTLLMGLAAPKPAKIRAIDAWPAGYPVSSFFKFFTKPVRPTVLVKITLDDGSTGWGQSVPVPTWSYETPESVLSTIRDYLAPALLGHDSNDIAGAHDKMRKAISPSFSTGMPIAKAGIDLALHDLWSKREGKPLAALWGRKPLPAVTLSWTVNVRELAEAEKLVDEGKAAGFENFNLKVAPDVKFDLALCRLVKKLAPEAFLWVDANGGYDLESALEAARGFAELGVDIFEQPVPANRLTWFRDIRALHALPILMDEGIVSSVELEEFIKLGLLDGVAMKPARTAGLWDARRQVEILEREGMLFLGSGLTDPDLSLAASLQLYGAYGLKYPAALNGPQFLRGSYLKEPFAVQGGKLPVPKGLGLGVEINEEKLPK